MSNDYSYRLQENRLLRARVHVHDALVELEAYVKYERDNAIEPNLDVEAMLGRCGSNWISNLEQSVPWQRFRSSQRNEEPTPCARLSLQHHPSAVDGDVRADAGEGPLHVGLVGLCLGSM
jgi:hypothetical protein